MLIAKGWKDYEVIDTGNGEKLERWGKYILRRPDPQVIWPRSLDARKWESVDAHYHRSQSGGGRWEFKKQIPQNWTVSYGEMSFNVRPTDFKHTGLFPEQAANWDWIIEKIKGAGRPIRLLNLFAYTGGASVAAAYAGAEVCHVDASKGMTTWAKENMTLSGLAQKPVRYIVDDCIKFVEREKRREKTYEAIIMDPPSYGRGPNGEVWKLEDKIYDFIEKCSEILSDKPLFFLVNSYTTGFSASVLKNMIELSVAKKFGGNVSCDEIGLPVTSSKVVLPCGTFSRWEAK